MAGGAPTPARYFHVAPPAGRVALVATVSAIAEKTAGTHPFVRVDLYNVGGRILFSEFTLYPNSGFGRFEPEEWDGILGSWLELPERKVK